MLGSASEGRIYICIALSVAHFKPQLLQFSRRELRKLFFCQSLIGPRISAIICSLEAFEGASATARCRLLRTLLGVLLPALQVNFAAYNLLNYGLAIALLGLLCSAVRLYPSSLRFGAIALTVVVSDPDQSVVWFTTGARFVDVALGIAVALLVVKAWPKVKNQDQ